MTNRKDAALLWIRKNYDVPAAKGVRVRYTGGVNPVLGTITGAEGAHVMIRLDGRKTSQPFHPTWCLEYGGAEGQDP